MTAAGTVAGQLEAYAQSLEMTGASDRTMLIERVIKAPVALVWGAWLNEASSSNGGGRTGFPAAPAASTCVRAANGCST